MKKDQLNENQPLRETAVISSALFRYFIRKHYAEIDFKNDELDALNIAFSDYLKEFLSEEQLLRILPKSEVDVIMNTENLSLTFGFHPALLYHFSEFVTKSATAIKAAHV